MRLNDVPGATTGWAKLLPIRKSSARLTGMRRASWVVVGAGFTGLACARRLGDVLRSDDIVLLDARQLAQNASGRNSGYAITISDYAGRFHINKLKDYQRINRINAAGLTILRQQVTAHQIECQWSETGFYRVAADHRALSSIDEFQAYLRAIDAAHTALNENELRAQLGTAHYKAGIKVDGGALLQPAALVYGLADTLPANVTLYENTQVHRLERGKTFRLITPDGEIESDNVVLATNHEAPELGILRNRLLGSTLSASCTRVLSDDEFSTLGTAASWGILSLHTGGATVRLTCDRRICIRNTAEYHGGALLASRQLAARRRIHRAAFDKRFPALAHVPFETSWSCVEGISWNGTNFFGKSDDNIYYAGGYNGSGLSRGTAFGTALADWALGKRTALVEDCLNCPKARRLPPRPFLDVGAWFTVRNRFRGVGEDL